jgi:hypothetical protein
MNLAEQNKADFDEFVGDRMGADVEYITTSLHTRQIVSTLEYKEDVRRLMESLTSSFSFECEEIFIDNGFGFEVTLPRILID